MERTQSASVCGIGEILLESPVKAGMANSVDSQKSRQRERGPPGGAADKGCSGCGCYKPQPPLKYKFKNTGNDFSGVS